MSAAQVKEPAISEGNIFQRFGRGFVNFFTHGIPNFFTKTIPGFFKKLGLGIGHGVTNFGKRFARGSIGTKISHVICGFGNLYRGQIIKGLLYLLLEVGYILYMVMCPVVVGPNKFKIPMGWKSLANLQLSSGKVYASKANAGLVSAKVLPKGVSQLFLLFGLVTIALTIIMIIVWNSSIKSSVAADTAVKEGRKPSSFKEDLQSLMDNKFHLTMLTPTILAATIFTVLPTIFMICMAFTTYNDNDMVSAGKNIFNWNGVNNFGYMFSGQTSLGAEIKARFFPVLGWTLIWAIFATFTCYFGGILLAILINKKGLKGKKVFRVCFILTIAIPQFISLLAMRNLLSELGPVNSMLKSWGWIDQSISFLGTNTTGNNPILAKVMVIIINMWLGIPYTMLMTSGILMNIPADLYEAARVDGTSKAKMFFKITLPYVIFITTPYLIGSFVGNINSFNTIFLLTGGGPSVGAYKAGETDLLVTWLYKLTIESGDYNTGAVIGILTFLITATITLVTYRRSKAYNEEDTFQ